MRAGLFVRERLNDARAPHTLITSASAPLSPDAVRVDVWRVRVADQLAQWDALWSRLDADERARAMGYQREADRQRFVVARATLRELLARQLHGTPADIRFIINAYGKPGLAPPHALHFNLSHAGDWVLLAFSPQAPVGIDVEACAEKPLTLDDVRDALAPAECECLALLPDAERAAALLRLWACKEAYVKAWGQGLSRSLREVCMRWSPDGDFSLVHDFNDQGPLFDWSLRTIAVDERHVGCLACPRESLQLRVLDYPG